MSDGVSAAIELSDPSDPRVAAYSTLSDAALRRTTDAEHGIFLAESSVVVRRALAAGMRPASFFLAHRYLDSMADVFAAHPDVPVYTGTDETMQSITGFHLHRGALAAMYRPQARSVASVLDGARRVALLDDVADHTNVGAIFRSATGMGVDGILLSPRSADPLYRRAIRVSMGTVFSLPWARVEHWEDTLAGMSDTGWTVAALELTEQSVDLDDPTLAARDRLGLVLGAEGTGVRPETLDACDVHVKIPMYRGVDSLNVSVAAAVAFWQLRPV